MLRFLLIAGTVCEHYIISFFKIEINNVDNTVDIIGLQFERPSFVNLSKSAALLCFTFLIDFSTNLA